MDRGERRSRRSLKRKLEHDFHENLRCSSSSELDVDVDDSSLSPQKHHLRNNHERNHQDLLSEINSHIQLLNRCFSWSDSDRIDSKRSTHFLSELAKNGSISSLSLHLFSCLSFRNEILS